ncbi:hypothetical protein TNIN_440421 [Trichonephila inaurata madagascariensis]|uniref:Uncharacterized protein n=1 Tax=Trichonephila inaurata madagascariensis TaxID=2747483 RepID=A0A8X7CIJ1_9ARAC|nr:hypothetical protein TNIN_440421 [Trichonephila inaurata madagascariensis]
MVELDWSPELRQVDTSRQKPLRCTALFSISNGGAGLEQELRQSGHQQAKPLHVQPTVPVFISMVELDWSRS